MSAQRSVSESIERSGPRRDFSNNLPVGGVSASAAGLLEDSTQSAATPR